jgi:hypothetical protein
MSTVFASIRSVLKSPRAIVVTLVVSGLVAAAGGAAMATRSASNQFADKAFDKLGGDSDQILDSIADKVVDKLMAKGGMLDSAQADLVDQLAAMAGKKFGKVDATKLLNSIRGDVVSAGLGKLDGISVDEIVAQVTSALIQQANGLLKGVDVEKLAKGAIADMIKSLNLEKLVKEKIDSVDIEKLAQDAIAKQMGGSSNPLTGLLGGLLKR